MSDTEDQLAEFREFLGDQDPGKSAFNPATASSEEFSQFLNGEAPDIEAMARKAKADKDAAEIEEYRQFARQQMESRGYDVAKGEWRKPEPVEESSVSPMPEAFQDEDGVVLVSPERFAEYVEHESPIGQLSPGAFEALLLARSEGREYVSKPVIDDPEEVNDIYFRGLTGGKAPDAE